jgi:RND superfamily putative drug exporter
MRGYLVATGRHRRQEEHGHTLHQAAVVNAPPRGFFYRVGRWSAAHPAVVALVWLGLLAGTALGHRALGGIYADNFTLRGTPAQQGSSLLKAHLPAASGPGSQLVFTVSAGSLSRRQDAIEQSMAKIRGLPLVLSASDPLAPAAVARNGRTAYATVLLAQNPQSTDAAYLRKVGQALSGARQAGVRVSYGGELGQAVRPKSKDTRSEAIGIAAALGILLAGFGSVYAAGLPVLCALVGAFTGVALLGMLAAATTFATASPTLAIMMGLGVGIDYAVFLTTRHRQFLADGAGPVDAAARSLATSGRAVVVAAVTVVIALLGLYASGISFIGKLGLAAGLTVAVAAISACTLVPAMLGLAGRSIDRARARQSVAEASAAPAGWQRYAERLGAHPWRYLAAGVAVLAILAVPAFSMRLGEIDAGADPAGSTARQAYDAVSAAFGPGANGPLTVVARLSPHTTAAQRQFLVVALYSAIARTPDVAAESTAAATPDGALLETTVLARTDPQATATDELMVTLQNRTLPGVLSAAGAAGYVTGPLAGQLQFRNKIGSRLPVIVATVIAAAFLLLLLTFRSPVLAVKAAVLNLFSIGAAYGVLVAIFQWGWGSSLLGVSEKVPIESYVPMLMFAVVFGLSMDYEVFLLTRVREAWLSTHDNQASVAHGLAATARVISCAALIMASVFFSFVPSAGVVVKMLAVGLGISVLIDASVIRLLIVPTSMFLFGTYNWWTPRWLGKIMPRPGPHEPVPEPPASRSGHPVKITKG